MGCASSAAACLAWKDSGAIGRVRIEASAATRRCLVGVRVGRVRLGLAGLGLVLGLGLGLLGLGLGLVKLGLGLGLGLGLVGLG